jgi:hypothetical protein
VFALVFAIGGTAIASSVVGSDSAKKPKKVAANKILKNGSVTNKLLKNNAVNGKKICARCVKGSDIDLKTLGSVPNADKSKNSDNAAHANNSDNAAHANNSDNAAHANNSDKASVADSLSNVTRINRFTLPIGRATVTGFFDNGTSGFGDDEHSNQRKEILHVGPISVVADCKRTTNGDNAGPDTAFTPNNFFDQDGDEAKVLVYTDNGTVTFNGPGESSRRNIPSGEGDSVDSDSNAAPNQEFTGGEGKHMAIAAARDPDRDHAQQDWVTAYKLGTIYISHSGGTEVLLTMYAGIDVLGAGNQCVFGGQAQTLHA